MPDTHCDFTTPTNPFMAPQPVCHTDDKSTATAAGIGLLVLSPVLMLVGMVIHADPVSFEERQRLAEAFNASLPPGTAEAEPPRPRTPTISFMAAPALSPGGASLSLGARF
jgi:hypothetical protein